MDSSTTSGHCWNSCGPIAFYLKALYKVQAIPAIHLSTHCADWLLGPTISSLGWLSFGQIECLKPHTLWLWALTRIRLLMYCRAKKSAGLADVVTLGDAFLGPAIRNDLIQPIKNAQNQAWWVSLPWQNFIWKCCWPYASLICLLARHFRKRHLRHLAVALNRIQSTSQWWVMRWAGNGWIVLWARLERST